MRNLDHARFEVDPGKVPGEGARARRRRQRLEGTRGVRVTQQDPIVDLAEADYQNPNQGNPLARPFHDQRPFKDRPFSAFEVVAWILLLAFWFGVALWSVWTWPPEAWVR